MTGSRGFTLLEMLVALTIFGLVTAMLAHNTWSGVWAARQAWTEASALRLAQSMAAAGNALPAGTTATSDPVIRSLPFRLKSSRSEGSGVTYRVEVSDAKDQVLATSTVRVPAEGMP
ncbi:type II secretion system protein [Nitrospirillum viridazoti]|uniref:Prepilin-type N-terminal cleavage/methylation domain-containing protein n=1 Tax=Nitrospirillum amazonense TaxID=28077 RepID=A0A560HQU9_9PROT|nr:type II secretion system protein [Nitrospirillum amazonense]TWB48952.1 prepilin-type N-terminal cleavage/methylation domain-containing protein [Nitrospirillum amazonense]